MKQIISASLLLITLMLPSNFSFASARWVNAESTPDFNTYVDSQTVSYNKDDNNITYWIKRTSPPAYGYTFMEQHSCNLTEKKIDILKSITYKQEIILLCYSKCHLGTNIIIAVYKIAECHFIGIDIVPVQTTYD